MTEVKTIPLFLETTIFIRRLLGSYHERARIDSNLNAVRCISSTYVLAEYKATLLRAAVDMYNCVAASYDVLDAIGRWDKYQGGRYKRGVNLLLRALITSAGDKESVLTRLEELIEVTLPLVFDELVDELIDPTECDSAHVEPRFVEGAYELPIHFPRVTAPEGLRRFLVSQQERLTSLHGALPTGRKYFRQLERDLSRLLSGDLAIGVRAWQRLTDVIIALEVPKDCELYTTNLAHFSVIADGLGVKLSEDWRKR